MDNSHHPYNLFENNQESRSHVWYAMAAALVITALLVIYLVNLRLAGKDEQPDVAVVKVLEPSEQPDLLEEEPPPPPPPEDPVEVDLTDTQNSVGPTTDMKDLMAQAVQDPSPVDTNMNPMNNLMSDVASAVVMANLSGGRLQGGQVGTASFMGQKGSGQRFAFLIDYSMSMKRGKLFPATKYELYSAIEQIGTKGMVSLLFFAGPAWSLDQNNREIKSNWENQGHHEYTLKTGAQGPNPQWLLPHGGNLQALERIIHETKLIGGTDWFPPFEAALSMNPRPDVIFFMTDGATSQSSIDRTMELIDRLPRGSVKINTIALGVDDKKAAPLELISKKTGGSHRRYTVKEVAEIEITEPPKTFSDRELQFMSRAEVMARITAANQAANQPETPPRNLDEDDVSF